MSDAPAQWLLLKTSVDQLAYELGARTAERSGLSGERPVLRIRKTYAQCLTHSRIVTRMYDTCPAGRQLPGHRGSGIDEAAVDELGRQRQRSRVQPTEIQLRGPGGSFENLKRGGVA